MSSTSGKRTSDDQDPNSDDQNGDLFSFMSKNAEEQKKLGMYPGHSRSGSRK